MDPIEPGLPFDRYDNPHITFRHRDDRIVDINRTDKKHASTITFLAGTPEVVIESDPGGAQYSARHKAHLEGEDVDFSLREEDVRVQMPPLNRIDPNASGSMHM
jgi:hypothetical protein